MKGRPLALVGIVMVLIALFGFTTGTGMISAKPGEMLDDFLYDVQLMLTGQADRGDTIRIASWNIEDFGMTKASDSTRMEILAGYLKAYDIIAVQEISNVREASDPGCPRNDDACPGHENCDLIRDTLEKYLNEDNHLNYSFVFSPQVKDERYLFIYDPARVELLDYWLTEDPGDSDPICSIRPESTGLMVRQPFAAKFRAGGFDFILLNVHTSPSMNLLELEGLGQIYDQVRQYEPDTIIIGDLNADCSYLGPDDDIALRDPEYTWVVRDDADTTVSRSHCAYDRFVFTSPTLEDFTGSWGIVGGVPDTLSNHYPIWAEFYMEMDTD